MIKKTENVSKPQQCISTDKITEVKNLVKTGTKLLIEKRNKDAKAGWEMKLE